ncbi:hypothetical protein [Streptomyces sp. NBC_00566]|uniref:hypothetical protein n=1 Tax=Streptomyces sp. NBC_00566 TaxID=2975778 RepID=UPI002E820009|nr:hypothetical protein [Streptomyces sp. NBC_00566]WUB87215.1 hypothetical protein OG812_11715 [Streptomyces sp. NBC_00566]
MSGGERYWNEDTQRWEEGAGAGGTAGATPPPRPDHAPPTPPAPAWPPAGEPREPAASDRRPTDPAPTPASDRPPADPVPTPPASAWPPAADSPASPAAERSSADPSPAPSASAWPPAEGFPAPRDSAWPPAADSPASPAAERSSADPSSALPAPVWPPAADSPAPPTPVWPPAGQSPTAAWPPADHPAPPTAPWPVTDPASTTADWPPADPSEPPAKGPSRRVLWSVIVGAAAAGVAVSLVLALVVGKDDSDDRGAVARRTPSAPATSAQETSADPTPSPSPSAPPAGYAVRDDSEGFRTAVPEGWTRASVPSEHGISVVNFRSPDRERRLQVYEVSEASPDASFELYLSPETAKPRGFEQLSLRNLDEGDFTGSRLEYLADTIRDEPEVGTWHVYDERFVASDGKIYALAAYGADADGRDDELELLTTALAWFCPPGMNCDDDGNAALD